MTKTFKLVREYSTGTRLFTQEIFFTVTPGSRTVEVSGTHSEPWSHSLDIRDARPLWNEFLSIKGGRFGGGFMGRWTPVKN